MKQIASAPVVDQVVCPVSDLQFHRASHTVTVDGVRCLASQRFTTSLFGHIGQSRSILALFDCEEVLERFLARAKDREDTKKIEPVRLSVLTHPNGTKEALGVVAKSKPILNTQAVFDLMQERGAGRVFYQHGTLMGEFEPCMELHKMPLSVGGDTAFFRHWSDVPLDGWGSPGLFVGMLRQICSNGMVAMSSAFRRKVNLSSEVHALETLARQLDGYTMSEQAVEAVMQRLAAAAATFASIREFSAFSDRVLIHIKRMSDEDAKSRSTNEVLGCVNRMRDSLAFDYGMGSIGEFTAKTASRAPTPFSVWDLMNMHTEIATHFPQFDGRNMQGAVGSLLVDEFDLAGIKFDDRTPVDPTPFHFLSKERQLALLN